MPVTLEEHEQGLVEMEEEGDSAIENKAFRYSRTVTEGSRGMELRWVRKKLHADLFKVVTHDDECFSNLAVALFNKVTI